MMKSARRVLKVLAISLTTVAISQSGVVLAATLPVATHQSSIEKGLRTPTRLAVGVDGSLYVADPANQGVLKFSAGKLVQKIAVKGIPQGVAVTADGRLLVSQKESVTIHDAAGAEIGRLGSGVGQFVAASDITLDDTGLIYVTDSKGACVQVFSGGGAYLSRFGVKGSAAGQFRFPTAIAFEKITKQIAVVDSLNGSVQFYDKNGAHVRSIGVNGTGPLKFMHPQGLAFEYGTGTSVRMYVSDAMLKVIQAIDPTGTGTFLTYIGAGKGSHGSPSDLAFDQVSRRLYVVDGMGSITVYRITDGNVVVDNVTPAIPGSATVITSTAKSGSTLSASVPSVSSVSPFNLSTVADGSTVSRELLNVTGLVSGVSAVTVNGLPVAVSNGLFSTAVPLAAGSNEITVTATDQSGRSWKEVRTVSRDSGSPALTVAAPDVQATGKAIMTLTGNVDAGVYVAVAGIPADISNQTWSAAVTLNPGLNTIEVQAIDLTGQISSQKRTVFYNATAPDLAITAPAEDVITSKKSVTITGRVTEGSGVAVSAEVNGIPKKVTVDDGRFNLPVEFPEEGSYTVNLYGSIGGNVSTISRTIVYRKAP